MEKCKTMRKLLIIILLLISLKGIGQKYESYERYYTESLKNGEAILVQFTDTCYIVIRQEKFDNILYILGKDVAERIVLDSVKEEKNNIDGSHSTIYLYKQWSKETLVSLTYLNGTLIQIDIIRLNNVWMFIIIPKYNML